MDIYARDESMIGKVRISTVLNPELSRYPWDKGERKTRPAWVLVDGGRTWVPCHFHTWSVGGDVTHGLTPIAIVETFAGKVLLAMASDVQFFDPEGRHWFDEQMGTKP